MQSPSRERQGLLLHLYAFATAWKFHRVEAFQPVPWPIARSSPWPFGLARDTPTIRCSGPFFSTKVFPEVPNEMDEEECTTLNFDNNDETSNLLTTRELNQAPEIMSEGLTSDDDLHWFRFAGIGRLYEDDGKTEEVVLDRLKHATVAIVGLGGVGSWTAESLCRSGIGNLVLVDLDDICISNTNRQLHTLSTNVGAMKTEVMRDRLVAIHPYCNITLIQDFVMLDNVQQVVGKSFQELNVDVVIDAIDGDEEKAGLIAACADHGIPVVGTGSPAGKSDPTQLVVADLTQVRGDKLLRACRHRLSNKFGFSLQPKDEDGDGVSTQQTLWNIPCVYSTQGDKESDSAESAPVSSFRSDGSLGTASFVTGTFGFVAASRVVEMIVDENLIPPNRDALKR